MPAIAVLAAAAAAWCFLQVDSRHLDALAGGAALNNANFLDNDQWLSTVSQYDRDKYWNRFRDVSTAATLSGVENRGSSEAGEGVGMVDSNLPRRSTVHRSNLRGTLKRTWKAGCSCVLPVVQVCALVGLTQLSAWKQGANLKQLGERGSSKCLRAPDGRLTLPSPREKLPGAAVILRQTKIPTG